MLKVKFYRKKWNIWLGIIISIITLGLACYNVEWQYLVQAVREVDVAFIFLGMACLYLNLILRAWRWQVLLRPIGRFNIFRACLPYYMIGYMSNLTLPFRAGEIIRPFLFGKKNGVSKAAVLASVFVERLFDMVFLAFMLLFVLFIGTMQVPLQVKNGAFTLGGIAFSLLFLLWGLSRESQLLVTFKLNKLLPKMIEKKITGWLNSANEGLKILHNTTLFIIAFCFTLSIWIFGVLTVQAYLISFGIVVPWYTPIFVIVVTNMGMMLPSSPGFIGVAHFLYVFSLSLFGIDKNTALGFAIVIHGISVFSIVTIGIIYLWREGLSFSNISKTTL